MITDRTRLVVAASAVLALALAAAGCGGDDKETAEGATVDEVLAQAKKNFDDAASVHLTLATDSKPSSGDAVLGADGTVTHQPAFEGTVKAVLKGFTVDVPIIAVDDKVWAKLPLTPKYVTIDPSEYSAPDPADFADPEAGISGLLLKMDGVKKDGTERDGKQIVTLYSGTLEGTYVAPIIPSASNDGDYETVVGIDDGGRIVTLEVTGEFFTGGGDETYELTFDDYDKSVKINAP